MNNKHINIFIIVCLLFCFSCSCSKKNNNKTVPVPTTSVLVPVVPANPPVTKLPSRLESGSNWTLVVPGEFDESIAEKKENNRLFIYAEKHHFLSLSRESFNGTLDEYVLLGLKSLKDDGQIDILEAKQTTLNGYKFVTIECGQNGASEAWLWITVKDNFGYLLACGKASSAAVDPELKSVCSSIANTFKFL